MNREVLDRIAQCGILPVINLPEPALAEPLVHVFVEEGLPAIEVTLRSPGALDSIRRIRTSFPQFIIGAGTVLTPLQVDEALSCGADFIVTPGFDHAIIEYCLSRGIPVVPGCATAGEITAARKFDLEFLKFFPAEANGGIDALKLLHGPFSGCRFIPTGGITLENLGAYLNEPCIAACGGSYMASAADIVAGRWDTIRYNCRRSMDISLGIELAHIGINHTEAHEAFAAAEKIAGLTRLSVREGNSSIFTGKIVEHMKQPYYGTHGHIGFTTRSTERALAWYRSRKIAIREESIRMNDQGRIQSFYLKEETAGFALHLVQR